MALFLRQLTKVNKNLLPNSALRLFGVISTFVFGTMIAPVQPVIETQFSCMLVWGRDPRISLQGVVTHLSGESVTVYFTGVDSRLLPDVGRGIAVEIDWVSSGALPPKQLVCRGTVSQIISNGDTTKVICRVRTCRFRDQRVVKSTTADTGWKM